MLNITNRVREFIRSEEGPTATEYAVMLALVVAVCLAAITLIGRKVEGTFTNLESNLPDGN